MIKTIKVKKQLRLDELIKYVRDNGINSQAFVSDAGRASVYFDSEQNLSLGEYTYGELNIERTFTVEVEEPITEDTRFKDVQEIYIDDEGLLQVEHHPILSRKSINDVLEEHDEETECLYIYAAVDGKTELIWEAE